MYSQLNLGASGFDLFWTPILDALTDRLVGRINNYARDNFVTRIVKIPAHSLKLQMQTYHAAAAASSSVLGGFVTVYLEGRAMVYH